MKCSILCFLTLIIGCISAIEMKKYKGEEYFDENYHPIIRAIDDNNIKTLGTLINNNNINEKGKNNLTFIFYSFLNNKKEAFFYMLKNGADVNIPFEETIGDSTYLINIATKFDDDYYFENLVGISNLNVKDERGLYPLHDAIMVNNEIGRAHV